MAFRVDISPQALADLNALHYATRNAQQELGLRHVFGRHLVHHVNDRARFAIHIVA